MIVEKALNQLLTCCSVVARKRHQADLADVLKQAGVLAGQSHLRDVEGELVTIVKRFEAKLISGGDILPEDLVLDVEFKDDKADFTPLPDESDDIED